MIALPKRLRFALPSEPGGVIGRPGPTEPGPGCPKQQNRMPYPKVIEAVAFIGAAFQIINPVGCAWGVDFGLYSGMLLI